VPHDFGIDYINIIKGLHYTLENKSKVANISLQPPEPYPFNEKEAMNIASRILSDSGVIVVIAAGNFGDRRGNSMNPWSVAPWVIGVGAAHSNGKKLWKYSSKGIAGDQLYHPTVVAPGVDIRSCGPDGKYTIESGTSCATAYVSGIALRLVEFINNIVKSPIISEWKNIAKTRFGTKIRPIQPYPYVIKMMIEDMAVEMPGYKRHEVGSGFIDENTATKYFKDFDLSDFIKLFAFNKKG